MHISVVIFGTLGGSMKPRIVVDTYMEKTKTFQIEENSKLRPLTFGEIKHKDTIKILKNKLGDDLKDTDKIVFDAKNLLPAEEIKLLNALVEEFSH